MSDVLIVTAFFCILFSPCLIALHASLAEEGPELGYAASLRRIKEKLISTFRV